MKMKVACATICASLAASFVGIADAAFTKGNQVVGLSVGGVIATDDLDGVQGAGIGGGVAYRYYLSHWGSLGGDVSYDAFGDHYSDESKSHVNVHLLTTSLTGRLDFWGHNDWTNYLTLGAGTHYLEQEFHDPGQQDTEKSGRFGFFAALGFEGPLVRSWMWGAELRSVNPLSGVSANALGLRLTMSRRFGKVPSSAVDNLIH